MREIETHREIQRHRDTEIQRQRDRETERMRGRERQRDTHAHTVHISLVSLEPTY